MQGQETDRSLQLSCGEHSDYGEPSHKDLTVIAIAILAVAPDFLC